MDNVRQKGTSYNGFYTTFKKNNSVEMKRLAPHLVSASYVDMFFFLLLPELEY